MIENSTAPRRIVTAPAESIVTSPESATLSNESEPSCTKMCPPEGDEISVSERPNVDVVDTNDNAPEPSVASTCPFEPSDEGSVNVRLEPIVSRP